MMVFYYYVDDIVCIKTDKETNALKYLTLSYDLADVL